MDKLLKRILSVIAIVALFTLNTFGNFSNAVADFGEFNPDYLVFRVGYEGGPYLNIHTFSRAEMENMNRDRIVPYTHIKGTGTISYDFAKGMELETLLRLSGIDKRSIKRFIFVTSDEYIVNNRDFYRDYILETDRYHYPRLIEYIDNPDLGKSGGSLVKPMLAYASLPSLLEMDTRTDREELKRLYDEAATGNTIVPHNGFRLMLGAPPSLENTARFSAQNVYQINVVLAGKPAANVKPVEVIRPGKYGNETITGEDLNNYQPQVGDIIKTEVEEDTVDTDIENDSRNQNTEETFEQATWYATDAFQAALQKHYAEENKPKLKVEVNEEVAKVQDDGSILVTGEGDLGLKAKYIDLGDKDIFEGRDGYQGFVSSFFKEKVLSGEDKIFNPIVVQNPELENPEPPGEGDPDDSPEPEPPGEGDPDDSPEPEKPGEGDHNDSPEPEKPGGDPDGKPGEDPDGKPGENPDGKPGGDPDGRPGGDPDGKPGGDPDGKPGGNPGGSTGNKNEIPTIPGSGNSTGGTGTSSGTGQGGSGDSDNRGSNSANETWLQISSSPISLGDMNFTRNLARVAGTSGSTSGSSRQSSTSASSGTGTNSATSNRGSASGNSSSSQRSSLDANSSNLARRSSSIPSEIDSIFNQNKAKDKQTEKKDRAISRQIYEMDEDSTILGELQLENPLKPWAAGFGVMSFIYGLFYARWRFIRSL